MNNHSKKYIVFSYDTFYPGGGLEDIAECFDDFEKAKEYINDSNNKWDNNYVVDRDTWEIIYKYNRVVKKYEQ